MSLALYETDKSPVYKLQTRSFERFFSSLRNQNKIFELQICSNFE